jgi:hypothetical protein
MGRKKRTTRRLTSSGMQIFGAIEGTRTPTPLRVHGPEPCASANSATMASGLSLQAATTSAAESGRSTPSFYRHDVPCQTSLQVAVTLNFACSARSYNHTDSSRSQHRLSFTRLRDFAMLDVTVTNLFRCFH